MQAVKKVAMVIVMENDLEAAVEFYKKLGLKLIFHLKERWAEFKVGDLQIGLCPTSEKIEYNRTGIVFEVADLAAFYEAQKDGLLFLDKPVEATHGIMVSLQDPSGNIIDLYQPTPQKVKDLAQKMSDQDSCCNGRADEATQRESCCKSEGANQGCC